MLQFSVCHYSTTSPPGWIGSKPQPSSTPCWSSRSSRLWMSFRTSHTQTSPSHVARSSRPSPRHCSSQPQLIHHFRWFSNKTLFLFFYASSSFTYPILDIPHFVILQKYQTFSKNWHVHRQGPIAGSIVAEKWNKRDTDSSVLYQLLFSLR